MGRRWEEGTRDKLEAENDLERQEFTRGLGKEDNICLQTNHELGKDVYRGDEVILRLSAEPASRTVPVLDLL